jgi:hypothetical protein
MKMLNISSGNKLETSAENRPIQRDAGSKKITDGGSMLNSFSNKDKKSPETYEEFYMRIFVVSMTLLSLVYFFKG